MSDLGNKFDLCDKFEAWVWIDDDDDDTAYWTAWCACGENFGAFFGSFQEAVETAREHYSGAYSMRVVPSQVDQ